MLELLIKGGWMMWPILICSIIALGLFFDRLFHLHRSHIKKDDFLNGIFNVMNRGNRAEAISICNQTPGPVAHLVRTALLNAEDKGLISTLNKTGLDEIPRLEKNLGGLLTIIYITPMLGLLGTLTGLLELFFIIEDQAPLMHVGHLSDALGKALMTSVFGIAVSIPALVGYHFLLSRINRIALNMEYATSEIHHFLKYEWTQRKREEIV